MSNSQRDSLLRSTLGCQSRQHANITQVQARGEMNHEGKAVAKGAEFRDVLISDSQCN